MVYIHVMSFFQDNLGKPAPEKQNHSGKTNLDLLEQETVSGSSISCAICKSTPRPRQITMPAPHHSVFTGRMPFLLPNQQRQITEGKRYDNVKDMTMASKFKKNNGPYVAVSIAVVYVNP